MDYIIFDLEWNQSSHPGEVDENGNTLPFEIVEIGAVKLNENRDMIGEFSELIKPQIYHEMHYITSKLIHLQMKQLEKGMFPNENNRLYTAAQVVIQMATRVVEEAEKLKLTDKQWYLAFEDYLNILSCKDHTENNQIEDLNNTLEEFKNGKDE